MDFSKLIRYMEDELCGKLGIPGCEIKVMQNHKVMFRHFCGFSDYEKTRPTNENTMYFMYSCTKPITCTAALQLLDKGVFALDTPVSKFLPAYKNAYLLKDGRKVAPKREMTIGHLMTMTAGLDYDAQSPYTKKVLENPNASTIDIVNSFIEKPLSADVGEKFEYSLCHDVLGAVIEVASGMKFSEYLKENIFKPLGMARTGFSLNETNLPYLAAQYDCQEDCTITPAPLVNSLRLNDNYEGGGAGLISCVEDYSLFVDAMANGGVGATGNQILKPETIDMMRKVQLPLFADDPVFPIKSIGPGYSYGLGVRTLVDKSDGQRSPIGEFGWDGAAGSYTMMDPENKLSIAYGMHVRAWARILPLAHGELRDLTYEALGL